MLSGVGLRVVLVSTGFSVLDEEGEIDTVRTWRNQKRRSAPDHPAEILDSSENILLLASDVDVIGIDEAQFFDTNLHNVCNQLADQGIRVIVAGLDMDFKGNPFGPMPALMATAEYVTKVHAVCTRTGNLAQYSYRKTSDESEIASRRLRHHSTHVA